MYNGSYYFQVPSTNSFLINKEIEYEDLDEIIVFQKNEIEKLKK